MQTKRHTIIYRLLVLCALLMISQAVYAESPDFPDVCGSGYSPYIGGTRNYGYIDPGDVDVFEIVIPYDGSLNVLSMSTSPMDPKGVLKNAGCYTVAEHWDGGGYYGLDFDITYPSVKAGEVYYLEVSHQGGAAGQGSYFVMVLVDPPAASNHTISASVNTSGGSISPTGSVSVNNGGSQSFNITADACYEIADVVVDSVSKGAIGTHIFASVNSDHTISASFAGAGDYTITADAFMGGSISPAGVLSIPCGFSITYTITPAVGNEILDVVVNGASQGPIASYSFDNITADHTISANFTALTDYTITTVAGANGSISPDGPISVTAGGSQAFTITPDTGYEIEDVWVGSASQGAITSYTFSDVNANHTIEAQFAFVAVPPPPPPPTECLDISDNPLDSIFQAAPANIIFLLDDSGSMDFEVMTPETDTEFYIPGQLVTNKRYVFDNPGDNTYHLNYHIMGTARQHWKSQWAGYNKMYYDPLATYNPWPNMPAADTATPRSHPSFATYTFDLTDEYVQVRDGEEVIVDDGDSEFSTHGDWTVPSTTETTATSGDWRQTTLDGQLKQADWRPDLIPDTYDVYVKWVADEALHDMDVEYQIYSNGTDKNSEVKVDQRYTGGAWQLIGREDFTADGFVRLEHDSWESGLKQASADAVKFVPAGPVLSITNAHYYTWHDVDHNGVLDSGETVYLVDFKDLDNDGDLDARVWYEFDDADGDNIVRRNELSLVWEFSVPEEVRPRSFADDLQNFANWYSYYRKRELTAIGAIASVITQVQGMQIGFYSIHENIIEPVRKVHVNGVDETDILLNTLYTKWVSNGNTPLRSSLMNIGKYLHQDDGDNGGIGDSPFAAAGNGGECQQAFVIMVTDGAYNGSTEPWDPAKNVDGDDGAPYADNYSNTLADVAMYFYENDMASNLTDLVPTSGLDNASHQHMVTYGVGFGINGSLVPEDYDFDAGSYPTWPDPSPAALEKVDDMWHATVNGRGKFLTASNAVELINDFLLILKDIELYSGSASSVAVNGDELYTKINNETTLYQSKYYNQTWHGDVLAFKVNDATGEIIKPAVWSAAHMLSNKTDANRMIATYDGTSSGQRFEYNKLTDLQRTLLDPNWATDAALANNMVQYLRGNSDNEKDNGGDFRNRSWSIVDPGHPNNGDILVAPKLGDIVHSSPVFKNGVLYSGGNDGMLHAFRADTGDELFAYVPNLVFENLAHLTDPDYTHKFYVDLTPVVRDVDVSGITAMLVGGLGKGGRGYYALDVSDVDPAGGSVPVNQNDVANMALWEYPNLNTPADETDDMGYSFSRVEIVETYDASVPWIVIFGNGYNSENGHAVLFLIDPASGTLIKRIDTLADSCNGLSSPTPVDVNYDGKVDYVYAGDLKGNLWKFDLTDDDYNNWDVAFYESGTPMPLFKTPNQPITTRPDVMYHCEEEGYMVLFGTGKLLGDSDISDTSQQSIYGIWDYGDGVDNTEYVGALAGGLITNPNLPASVSLLQQSFIFEDFANGNDLRVLSGSTADWMTTTTNGIGCGENPTETTKCDPNGSGENADPLRHAGWYLDLPGNGERVVSNVFVREGKLVVISYSPAGTLCGTGGNSWVMQMGACSGARLPSGQFDVNNDGVIDEQDLVNISDPATPVYAVATGVKFSGQLQPPAIILINSKQEMMYMSSSRGEIETLRKRAARLGIIYWRVYNP